MSSWLVEPVACNLWLEIWDLENLKNWDPTNKKNKKIKSVLTKMSARSGFAGKILLVPFGAIPGHVFHGPEKSNLPIFLGGPMGPIHPVWAMVGPIGSLCCYLAWLGCCTFALCCEQ